MISSSSTGLMDPNAITGSFVLDQLPPLLEIPETPTVSAGGVSEEKTTLMDAATREAFYRVNNTLISQQLKVIGALNAVVKDLSESDFKTEIKQKMREATLAVFSTRSLLGVLQKKADVAVNESLRRSQVEATFAGQKYPNTTPPQQIATDLAISSLAQSPTPDELKLKIEEWKVLFSELNKFIVDLSAFKAEIEGVKKNQILPYVSLPDRTDEDKALKKHKIREHVVPAMEELKTKGLEKRSEVEKMIELIPFNYRRLVKLFDEYNKIHTVSSPEELKKMIQFAASVNTRNNDEIAYIYSSMFSDYIELESLKSNFENIWKTLEQKWGEVKDSLRECRYMEEHETPYTASLIMGRYYAIPNYFIDSITFPLLSEVPTEPVQNAPATSEAPSSKGWFKSWWDSFYDAPNAQSEAIPVSSSSSSSNSTEAVAETSTPMPVVTSTSTLASSSESLKKDDSLSVKVAPPKPKNQQPHQHPFINQKRKNGRRKGR